MIGTTWEVPWQVKNYIVNYPETVRGWLLEELLDKATFKRVSWFWYSGATLHPDCVILDDSVTDSDDYEFMACVVAHELVHVAQQEDWGHVSFILQYGWQALRCGFRYECLKKRNIEREAFEFEERFGMDIGFYKPRMYQAACTNRVRVERVVDFELKQKFVKRGQFKPSGKTAWAKRR